MPGVSAENRQRTSALEQLVIADPLLRVIAMRGVVVHPPTVKSPVIEQGTTVLVPRDQSNQARLAELEPRQGATQILGSAIGRSAQTARALGVRSPATELLPAENGTYLCRSHADGQRRIDQLRRQRHGCAPRN
jgi:hypothetical protein